MIKFSFIRWLSSKKEVDKLPQTNGVYCFKNRKKILYIGKALNIRRRIKSHFSRKSSPNRLFLNKVRTIGYVKTDSEIEALILEAKLIKKYQPKHNILWRDDKNYFFVGITNEDFPRVFLTHQLKIKNLKLKIDYVGPFIDGGALKQTLKYLRKVFPYYSVKKHPKTLCPWCHLNLCPGANPDKNKYKKSVRGLMAILKGEKLVVLKNLKKEMELASKKQDFEKAAEIKGQIISLNKVLSHAKIFKFQMGQKINWPKIQKLLQKILKTQNKISRIEAYDVSNIQGKKAAGSMVVFIGGRPEKNFYRRFKIKIAGKPNDVAMLKETLTRRFSHPEWTLPDLILIDGGRPQLNVALDAKRQTPNTKHIKIASLAKKKNELFIEGRKKKPVLLKSLPREIFNLILQLRDEAHRFAIAYHRKLRSIDLFGKFW